ncbi:response regulator transcription factor [Metabacillus malikii]|uniref:YesN/AraC family two-component response regulator n=1 Tax=Metabacillus malikii TaxID=1504265 RepID=A0ABT9ZAV7_9BACI|nr:response regulator [Metabacillus malikii]MDQ0229352.1 YesN/AraC family two-component response regulator [Metabacillus malikii]
MLKKSILIVDDEPRTREGLKKTLDNWSDGKYEIISADSAKAAIPILRQKNVTILLTDISMPEISGLEMLKLLKEEGKNLVVIVISAYSEFDYAREALQLGVLNYLLKPLTKDKLIEAVEQALTEQAKREREEKLQKVVDARLADIQDDELEEKTPITTAIKYIDEHLEKPFTMKDVAQHVHLNSSYFSALFKEQVNMTFSEYVTRRRLEKAKKLLLFTKQSVTGIAEQVGYNTSKYFIKLFKENTGQTPSQYRKNSDINEIEKLKN